MSDTVKLMLVLLIMTTMIGVFVLVGNFAHRVGQVTLVETRINRVLEHDGGFTNSQSQKKQISDIQSDFGGKSQAGGSREIEITTPQMHQTTETTNLYHKYGYLPYGYPITYSFTFKTPIIPVVIPSFGTTQVRSTPMYHHTYVVTTTSKRSPTDSYGNNLSSERPY